MALNYETATNLEAYLKILLFGLSGSGKSYAAAKAGGKTEKVAVLLLEPNGLPSIRASNPDAIVVMAYDPKRYGKVYVWEIVDQFMQDAMDGTLTRLGVTTIVVDSLTELQRVWRDRTLIDEGVARAMLAKHKMTQQQWGLWTERFRRLLRAFRDLPMNIVAVALVQNETDDDGNITAVVPSFEGKKLPSEVAQFFSAVGYCFKREFKIPTGEGDKTESKVEHKVMFQTGGKLVVKPFPGLDAIEAPDPKIWMAKYAASIAMGEIQPIVAGKTGEVDEDAVIQAVEAERKQAEAAATTTTEPEAGSESKEPVSATEEAPVTRVARKKRSTATTEPEAGSEPTSAK